MSVKEFFGISDNIDEAIDRIEDPDIKDQMIDEYERLKALRVKEKLHAERTRIQQVIADTSPPEPLNRKQRIALLLGLLRTIGIMSVVVWVLWWMDKPGRTDIDPASYRRLYSTWLHHGVLLATIEMGLGVVVWYWAAKRKDAAKTGSGTRHGATA